MRKTFIAGNWKMNKTSAEALAFAEQFAAMERPDDVDCAIAAPFTQLAALKRAFEGSGIRLAAQNMHFETQGAYTGEISPAMLADLGVDYCIIGHSERRAYFGETDETVNKKVHAAFASGIVPICCVGESLSIREEGRASEHVVAQVRAALHGMDAERIAAMVIAYEPIWAIGTGRTATTAQAGEMCSLIRETVAGLAGKDASDRITIQYGGSVNPDNATALMRTRDIDGALVGGASLAPEQLLAVLRF